MNAWLHDTGILALGMLVGALNTLGGGGSSILYPVLIFMGFSPHQAVGTARPAFLTQGLFGAVAYARRGRILWPFALWMGLAALAGAFIGAAVGLALPAGTFKKVIAVVVALVSLSVLLPKPASEEGNQPDLSLSLNLLLFFFLGMYSGFIQTGLGFLILIVLAGLNRLDIHTSNGIKAVVIMLAGIPSLLMYASGGYVLWRPALILAAGTAAGAYLTGYFSVRWPVRTVKGIISAMAVLMAVRLWFWS